MNFSSTPEKIVQVFPVRWKNSGFWVAFAAELRPQASLFPTRLYWKPSIAAFLAPSGPQGEVLEDGTPIPDFKFVLRS
jgi:hypothetical protein